MLCCVKMQGLLSTCASCLQPPRRIHTTSSLRRQRYLSEGFCVACHEQRHGQQLYLAKAVSLKDLHQHVKERVPEGTNIPSVKWLRYQFQPLNPRGNTANYYKGQMNIKMMVQKRQVRLSYRVKHGQ